MSDFGQVLFRLLRETDRLPHGINGRDVTQTPTGFLEITGVLCVDIRATGSC